MVNFPQSAPCRYIEQVQLHSSLTSALEEGKLSATSPSCCIPKERAPPYPLNKTLGGPQSQTRCFREEKSLLVLLEVQKQTVQSIAQLLQWLSCLSIFCMHIFYLEHKMCFSSAIIAKHCSVSQQKFTAASGLCYSYVIQLGMRRMLLCYSKLINLGYKWHCLQH